MFVYRWDYGMSFKWFLNCLGLDLSLESVIDRSPKQICKVPAVLSEVLLLVFGEIHQVPEQKRLHYGVCLVKMYVEGHILERTNHLLCKPQLFIKCYIVKNCFQNEEEIFDLLCCKKIF